MFTILLIKDLIFDHLCHLLPVNQRSQFQACGSSLWNFVHQTIQYLTVYSVYALCATGLMNVIVLSTKEAHWRNLCWIPSGVWVKGNICLWKNNVFSKLCLRCKIWAVLFVYIFFFFAECFVFFYFNVFFDCLI